MSVKRYHTTLKAAREYITTQSTGHGLRIWPIKKATTDKKYWVGTYLEWLNRY